MSYRSYEHQKSEYIIHHAVTDVKGLMRGVLSIDKPMLRTLHRITEANKICN